MRMPTEVCLLHAFRPAVPAAAKTKTDESMKLPTGTCRELNSANQGSPDPDFPRTSTFYSDCHDSQSTLLSAGDAHVRR